MKKHKHKASPSKGGGVRPAENGADRSQHGLKKTTTCKESENHQQILIKDTKSANLQRMCSNPKRSTRTICSFSSWLVVAAMSAILVPLLATWWNSWLTNSSHSNLSFDVDSIVQVPRTQSKSLLEPFTLNYAETRTLREENMAKYNFPYSRWGIDRRANLSLEEFYEVYDGKWPVIVTDVVPTWNAANWSGDFFNEHYGKERVTMKAVDRQLDLQFDLALSEVLPPLLTPDLHIDQSHSAQGGLEDAVSLALPLGLFWKNHHVAGPSRWTYVEDELFIPSRPQLQKDIGQCIYLDEDYYQLFPAEVKPWNTMLLWGTAYSRSSLHIDPYNWTGTNAVLKGVKRWKLYPPGQDHLLYVEDDRRSGFPLNCYKYNSDLDAFAPDHERYPLFKKASAIEFDQYPGEMLFIPTGWFHQAFNVEETIAVSSQVMNRNNARVVLEEIIKAGNIRRRQLPPDIDMLSPAMQTKAVMKLLPASILERGRAVTQDVLNQIAHGFEGSRYMVPDGLREEDV